MARRKNGLPKTTPDLSAAKLNKGAYVPMTKSGFCQFGPGPAHEFCFPSQSSPCDCDCHATTEH